MKRAEAKSLGHRRYFTGKPCKRGHVADRNTSTGNCTACLAEDNARHYAENAVTERERSARHYRENGDYFRSYYAHRKEDFRARDQARRSRRLNATPPWYGELDDFVMREAADLCRLRELATGLAWQVDHMVPLQAKLACGLHCAANIQVMPARLNKAKNNRLVMCEPFDWMKYV